VACLLWADSTALQYLVTGLVHQLGSYWMHRAMLIDLDAVVAVCSLFVWGQYQYTRVKEKRMFFLLHPVNVYNRWSIFCKHVT